MAVAILQAMFKPNPGADLMALNELTKESAVIWRRHGATVNLWAVQIGEIGNMVFTIRCDSSAKLGEAIEAVNNDPAQAIWRAKVLKAGLASWVRSNHVCEIPI